MERQRAEIVLTEDEREILERWARRPKSAQALALRCRIVLAAAEGHKSIDIAAELGCSRTTVGKWRTRFAEQRLDGLHDEPRPGAPRTINDEDVERVVVKTLEETPTDATHWSTRSMAKATGMSQSGISRIWRAFGLKPRQRAEEFRRFLNLIDKSVPAHLDVHLIVDNSSTHKTPSIKRWLVRHPRFTLHFTPTYSSWLNLVERWFAELTTKWLRRGTHRSVRELVASIRTWIANWNDDPKPFVWHKTADEILASLGAYCARISGSGH